MPLFVFCYTLYDDHDGTIISEADIEYITSSNRKDAEKQFDALQLDLCDYPSHKVICLHSIEEINP